MKQTRTTRVKDERKKIELLAAARQVMKEKGMEDMTITEIVRRAGVAQGTFYLYFPSKTSLVVALAEEMLQSALERVMAETEGLTAPSAFIDKAVPAAFQQFGLYSDVYPILNNGGGFVKDAAQWDQLFEPFYSYVSLLLGKWQEEQLIDGRMNPEFAARMVVSLIEQAVEDCYLYRPDVDAAAYLADLIYFIRKALGIREA
ncbi:hypothetical protein BBD42_19385 [Paenibacillus sp. BIHB 4019]|uniref:HTH tetR-type domain-containing protein n=1 Tax=Paenibacillus sp. BIHB 4019 TaxID=1870819 RepID=A0A1B2DL09_9BACL|nr:TetR/AcrR family transcriptional regulator [Paenibacillus sp. BIHB 4019]ANY68393.1 hypothetical protein BBD42_19385 [Paenibacillus sp. BIHB 4019]